MACQLHTGGSEHLWSHVRARQGRKGTSSACSLTRWVDHWRCLRHSPVETDKRRVCILESIYMLCHPCKLQVCSSLTLASSTAAHGHQKADPVAWPPCQTHTSCSSSHQHHAGLLQVSCLCFLQVSAQRSRWCRSMLTTRIAAPPLTWSSATCCRRTGAPSPTQQPGHTSSRTLPTGRQRRLNEEMTVTTRPESTGASPWTSCILGGHQSTLSLCCGSASLTRALQLGGLCGGRPGGADARARLALPAGHVPSHRLSCAGGQRCQLICRSEDTVTLFSAAGLPEWSWC